MDDGAHEDEDVLSWEGVQVEHGTLSYPVSYQVTYPVSYRITYPVSYWVSSELPVPGQPKQNVLGLSLLFLHQCFFLACSL